MNDETFEILKNIKSGKARYEASIHQFGQALRKLVRQVVPQEERAKELTIRIEELENQSIEHLGPLFDSDRG